MFNLLKYLKRNRLQALLAPLFKMLEAIFELFVPLVVANMIDKGIGMGDVGYTMKMGGLLIVLAAVGLGISVTAQYFSAVAAVGAGQDLRLELFRHIESLSYKEMDAVGNSTLITRMTSDVNQVQNGINMLLRLFLRSPFVVFGALIMAFTVDARTALIFCIVLPLLIIVVCGITYGSLPLYKKVQERLDKVTLLTRESLVGVRVVRAFNREDKEIEAFDEAAAELRSEQLRVGNLSAIMNPVTYVIVNLGIAAIIYKGGMRVDAGRLSQGQVVALVNYMSQILIELIKLANLIVTLTKASACANRVDDVLSVKSSISFKDDGAVHTTKDAPCVEFRNVSLNYNATEAENDSEKDSLSGVSFKAMHGETIGIIGGTGSGKSSLVNLIPRFYDATGGTILIDGQDIKDYSKKELRSKIGVVPQKAVLFKGRVSDNIRWGLETASDDDIRKALDTAQALSFIEEKEDGIDFQLNQGARNLSGGQKQRVTIARALVRNPEILILDDSSSALDYATDASLRTAIKSYAEGRMTVFLVSQRASSIMHADRIIVLDDGEVAGIGRHEELLQTCGVYKEICQSQMGSEVATS